MTQINNLTSGLMGNIDVDLYAGSLQKAQDLAKRQFADDKKFKDAVNGFEAMLIQEMFKSLWSTVETKGWLGEDETNEAKIYRDMLNQALADSIAQGKGVGVKDVLVKELAKQTNSPSLPIE